MHINHSPPFFLSMSVTANQAETNEPITLSCAACHNCSKSTNLVALPWLLNRQVVNTTMGWLFTIIVMLSLSDVSRKVRPDSKAAGRVNAWQEDASG